MNTRPLLQVAGSHVSKFLNLNVSGTKKDVAPTQSYDGFSSVGDTFMPFLLLSIPGQL